MADERKKETLFMLTNYSKRPTFSLQTADLVIKKNQIYPNKIIKFERACVATGFVVGAKYGKPSSSGH